MRLNGLSVGPLLTAIFVLVLPIEASPAARHTTLKFKSSDWHGYVQELTHPRDMESRRILSEIEDGPRELARARVAAKHAGIPLTVTDLQRPLPPADQNAAPVYIKLLASQEQCFSNLVPDPEPSFFNWNWDNLTWRKSYTPRQIAIIKHGMARERAVIDAVHEAARRPYCVFALKFALSDEDVIRLQGGAYLRDAGYVLAAISYLSARDGDYADAIANAKCGIVFARRAESFAAWLQPTAMPMEYTSLDSFDNILHLDGANAGALQAVNAALADDSPTPTPTLRPDYVEDEPSNLYSLEIIRQQGPDALPTAYYQHPADTPHYSYSPYELHLFSNLVDALEAVSINAKIRLAPHADDDYKAKVSLCKAGNNALANADDDPIEQYEQEQLDAFVTWIDYEKLELLAHRNVLLAADKALRIKAATGRFPQALPGAYMDPFNKKLLRYHTIDGNGFVVKTINQDADWPPIRIPATMGYRNLYELPVQCSDAPITFEYPGPKPVPVTDTP